MMSGRQAAAGVVLRVGLALVFLHDLQRTAVGLAGQHAGALTNPMAPALLVKLAGSRAAILLLSVLALLALAAFVARWRPVVASALALGCMTVISEAHAAVTGGPGRFTFHSGAALLGWMGGLLYARGGMVGRSDADGEAERAERLARYGAIGMIAATYLIAGFSKVTHAVGSWIDPDSIRSLVLAEHTVHYRSLLDRAALMVVQREWLLSMLAAGTVLLQAGAFMLLLGPRARALWGALLIAFHATIWVLSGIGYVSSMCLLALFTLPWPRLLPGGVAATEEVVPEKTRVGAAVAVYLAVAAAWLLPLARYNEMHHMYRGERMADAPADTRAPQIDLSHLPPEPPARALALLAPLTPGSDLGSGYRLVSAEERQGRVRIEIAGPSRAALVLGYPHLRTPGSTASFVVHREPPSPEPGAAAALDKVARQVRDNDHGDWWKVLARVHPPPPVEVSAPPPVPWQRRSWGRPLVLGGGLLLTMMVLWSARRRTRATVA